QPQAEAISPAQYVGPRDVERPGAADEFGSPGNHPGGARARPPLTQGAANAPVAGERPACPRVHEDRIRAGETERVVELGPEKGLVLLHPRQSKRCVQTAEPAVERDA